MKIWMRGSLPAVLVALLSIHGTRGAFERATGSSRSQLLDDDAPALADVDLNIGNASSAAEVRFLRGGIDGQEDFGSKTLHRQLVTWDKILMFNGNAWWRMTAKGSQPVEMSTSATFGDDQDWSYDKVTRQLKNRGSGKCLEADPVPDYYVYERDCADKPNQRWFYDRNNNLRCEHGRFWSHCIQLSSSGSKRLYMANCDDGWGQHIWDLNGQLQLSETSVSVQKRGYFRFKVGSQNWYPKAGSSGSVVETVSWGSKDDWTYHPDTMRLKRADDGLCLTWDTSTHLLIVETCRSSGDNNKFKQMWYLTSNNFIQNAWYSARCVTRHSSTGKLKMEEHCTDHSEHRRIAGWSTGFWEFHALKFQKFTPGSRTECPDGKAIATVQDCELAGLDLGGQLWSTTVANQDNCPCGCHINKHGNIHYRDADDCGSYDTDHSSWDTRSLVCATEERYEKFAPGAKEECPPGKAITTVEECEAAGLSLGGQLWSTTVANQDNCPCGCHINRGGNGNIHYRDADDCGSYDKDKTWDTRSLVCAKEELNEVVAKSWATQCPNGHSIQSGSECAAALHTLGAPQSGSHWDGLQTCQYGTDSIVCRGLHGKDISSTTTLRFKWLHDRDDLGDPIYYQLYVRESRYGDEFFFREWPYPLSNGNNQDDDGLVVDTDRAMFDHVRFEVDVPRRPSYYIRMVIRVQSGWLCEDETHSEDAIMPLSFAEEGHLACLKYYGAEDTCGVWLDWYTQVFSGGECQSQLLIPND